jgi:phosphohistidine swiveling domain-containing protein
MIVTNFKEIGKQPIGGKAKGLFELQQGGFNVPDFFVVTTTTFSGVDKEDFQFSDEDTPVLHAILDRWDFPRQPVVVRSSIVGEDSTENSFAGLFDSYLNLKTRDDVLNAIHATAKSANSERVQVYKKNRKIGYTQPAVIVQKQVDAVSSGILFTTSTEFPQEIAIHAVPGFSEYLNQGEDVPDEFYIWKNDGAVSRKIIVPKSYWYTSQSTRGLIKSDLTIQEREKDTLTPEQLATLYKTAQKIEAFFQKPMDVEFVFDEKNLFVVQARPISVKIPEVIVYDNSNIQESYCGVTTPLTFSFATRAYATVYRQTMHALGLGNRTVNKNEHIVQHLLGLVKGRIYYNINNWYRGLQLLPSFKQNKSDMEKMMGLVDPVDFVKDVSKTLSEKFMMLPRLVLNLARLLLAFRRLTNDVQNFLTLCRSYSNTFYKLNLNSLGVDDLLHAKEKLDATLLEQWIVPIVNDFNVMMLNGAVLRKLQKSGIPNPDDFLRYYLASNEQLASLAPVRELQALALEVKSDESLCALVTASAPDVHHVIATKHPLFSKKVTDYIDKYGDRTIGELKLETETMRLNPGIFYKYLQNLVAASSAGIGGGRLREHATRDLKSSFKIKNPISLRRLLKKVEDLEVAINRREAMRLERSRLFGMYRHIFLAIGARFVSLHLLDDKRDIFYLTEPEIMQYTVEGNQFKSRVAERKCEFELYRKETVPSRITIPYPPIEANIHQETEGVLKGTGLRNGTVEGEVMIVHDASGDLNVNGKIICALRTDPGWAPLFPACKAVLIERGSSLSHSVILLRELQIPAIINIPNLTARLKSGDYVRMNTDEGTIEILNHATD